MTTKAEFGRTIQQLRGKARTPFYLYGMDGIRARARSLRQALRTEDRALYAMKANPHPEILRLLSQEGWGVDAVSGGEIRRAL